MPGDAPTVDTLDRIRVDGLIFVAVANRIEQIRNRDRVLPRQLIVVTGLKTCIAVIR